MDIGIDSGLCVVEEFSSEPLCHVKYLNKETSLENTSVVLARRMNAIECHWSKGYHKKFKDILKIQAFSGERTLLSTPVDVLRTNSNDISDWMALVRRVVLEAQGYKIIATSTSNQDPLKIARIYQYEWTSS